MPDLRLCRGKDRHIAIPAFATAFLLSGAPVPVDGAAPFVVAIQAVADQPSPEQPAEPASPVDPLIPAVPPQAGAPTAPVAPSDTAPTVSSEVGAEPAPPGEASLVVVGRSRRGDPLSEVNAESFGVTQAVDEAVVGPVARAYKEGLPRPIRSGIRNFINNLREPIVAVNYLLQLKPGKAAETVGRFAINSTVGAAGLVDMAKRRPFNLPRRRNGFANTLGYYGVKPGPFLYLPLIGATTVRDLIGSGIDQLFNPITNIRPFNRPEFVLPVATLSALDNRVEFDEELEALRATRDPYAATRRFYLDRREAEINALRGRPTPMPVPGAGSLPAEPEPPR